MPRVMYIDCQAGVAGDMLLGALLDAGVPIDVVRGALGSLGVAHDLRVARVDRCGLTATKVDVISREAIAAAPPRRIVHAHGPDGRVHEHRHDPEHARSLDDVREIIAGAALSAAAKARADAHFRRLAEVEAAVHGVPIDAVHFHEVGAVDSIVDIIGVTFAIEWLGLDDIIASPLNVGGGTVEIAHGRFPVPAPATIALLQGAPIFSQGTLMERVTPTGALLVSAYARSFGPMPAMTVEAVGYGAGTRDTPDAPNVVRVVIGSRAADAAATTVLQIEAEIDDMNPQLFGPVVERLFEAGALDVFLTPIQMKKGRPGTLVTVLAKPEDRAAIVDLVFRETTTIGLRVGRVEREVLERRWESVTVAGGQVRIKIAGRGDQVFNVAPEFDDCISVARAAGLPVKTVQAEALQQWHQQRRPSL